MTNVILVDDHELFRLGIRGSLKRADVCILGEAESGKQLFTLLKTLKPDLIFLDIILPDTTGIDIARRLRDSFPEIKILILSAENTMETVSDLLRIGIDGFISKRRCNSIELTKAVRVIMEGENYYGRDISSLMYEIVAMKRKMGKEGPVLFSDREAEIIRLSHEGLTAREIGERLYISRRTVETHKTHIFQKLGINNTHEMLQYAIRCGLISPDE